MAGRSHQSPEVGGTGVVPAGPGERRRAVATAEGKGAGRCCPPSLIRRLTRPAPGAG